MLFGVLRGTVSSKVKHLELVQSVKLEDSKSNIISRLEEHPLHALEQEASMDLLETLTRCDDYVDCAQLVCFMSAATTRINKRTT